MLTQPEYDDLFDRVKRGKKWIWEQPGNWGGNTNPPFDYHRHLPRTKLQKAIVHWFKLSDELLKEQIVRGVFK